MQIDINSNTRAHADITSNKGMYVTAKLRRHALNCW